MYSYVYDAVLTGQVFTSTHKLKKIMYLEPQFVFGETALSGIWTFWRSIRVLPCVCDWDSMAILSQVQRKCEPLSSQVHAQWFCPIFGVMVLRWTNEKKSSKSTRRNIIFLNYNNSIWTTTVVYASDYIGQDPSTKRGFILYSIPIKQRMTPHNIFHIRISLFWWRKRA